MCDIPRGIYESKQLAKLGKFLKLEYFSASIWAHMPFAVQQIPEGNCDQSYNYFKKFQLSKQISWPVHGVKTPSGWFYHLNQTITWQGLTGSYIYNYILIIFMLQSYALPAIWLVPNSTDFRPNCMITDFALSASRNPFKCFFNLAPAEFKILSRVEGRGSRVEGRGFNFSLKITKLVYLLKINKKLQNWYF